MKKIIEIQVSEMMIEPRDYGIKYLWDRYSMRDLVDAILEVREGELLEDDIVLNYVKEYEQEILDRLREDIDEEELEYYETIQDFIDQYGVVDVLEDIIGDNEDADTLCKANKCSFGTVGYSDWSFYVAREGQSHEFIRDLWEGWNWYDFTIIEEGEEVDFLSELYVTGEEELDRVIYEHFGIDEDDYMLVDNSCSEYLDRPKVKKIVHRTYEYKEI